MGTYAKSVGPQDLFTITFEAEGSVTANALVTFGSLQHECKDNDTNNSKLILGVNTKTSAVADGNPVPVRVHGTAEVIAASSNIAAGDFLYAATTSVETIGAAIPATSFNIVGRALTASQTKGDVIKMLLLTIPGATVS